MGVKGTVGGVGGFAHQVTGYLRQSRHRSVGVGGIVDGGR